MGRGSTRRRILPRPDLAGTVEVPLPEGMRHPSGGSPPRHPVRMLLLLGFMSALGPASMDIYVPGLPTIADSLGTTASATQLTVGSFLLGLGGGQLVAGPMSDAHGRRRPLMVSLVAYMVATGLCAAAPGIEALVVGRFLQGASAAAGVVIGRAVIRDLYSGAQGARYLSRLILIVGLAPVVAPAVGAVVLTVTSWRGLFVVLVAGAGVLLAAVATSLPETLPVEARQAGGVRGTLRAFRTLVAHRAFVGYASVLGLGMVAIVTYLAGAPFLLQDVHGVSPLLYAGLFSLSAVAMIVASQLNAHLVERVGPDTMLTIGVGLLVASGAVLVTASAAGLLVPIVIGFLLAMFAWGLGPPNAIALAMADHPAIAGSAAALLGLFQYTLAALAAPLPGLGGRHGELAVPVIMLVTGLLATVALVVARRSGVSHERVP